jgi:hypothetical protein
VSEREREKEKRRERKCEREKRKFMRERKSFYATITEQRRGEASRRQHAPYCFSSKFIIQDFIAYIRGALIKKIFFALNYFAH